MRLDSDIGVLFMSIYAELKIMCSRAVLVLSFAVESLKQRGFLACILLAVQPLTGL